MITSKEKKNEKLKSIILFTVKKFKFLTSFSILTNGKNLFRINTKSSNTIKCLNGIRSLSIIWVIYVHAHIIGSTSTVNMNQIKEVYYL